MSFLAFFLLGFSLSFAGLAALKVAQIISLNWPDAALRSLLMALAIGLFGPPLFQLAADQIAPESLIWAVLYFVVSIPLSFVAYFVNRTQTDPAWSPVEILWRSSLTALIMTALVVGAYWLVGLAFIPGSIEFFGLVAAVVIPAGGVVMTWTFAFDEWTKGGIACLTYCALPACVALIMLVGD